MLSKIAGKVAQCSWKPMAQIIIRRFINAYHIDLSIAEKQLPDEYHSFHDFFTRLLRADARPLDSASFVFPCDGTLADIGCIEKGLLIQAKKHSYTLAELTTDKNIAAEFEGGYNATIYLAPRDYHRVHMPCNATLIRWRYVPGKLFSVNKTTAKHISGLYALNERLVCHFKSGNKQFFLIMVGAMLVSGIVSRWHGKHKSSTDSNWRSVAIEMKKNAEIGYFCFGSTVVLAVDSQHNGWCEDLSVDQPVVLGKAMINN